MAGNLVSLVAVSAATSRQMTPDCKPVRFMDTVISNKDHHCSNCGTHFHRRAGSSRKCPFCGEGLNIKRGRKPKYIH